MPATSALVYRATAAAGVMALSLVGLPAPASAADPTWGSVIDLATTSSNENSQRVVSSADGKRVTAVWTRNNGSNTIVQARTSVDGGAAWGATTDLSAIGQSAFGPQIVSSAEGSRIAVVWYRSNGLGDTIVQARTSIDGGTTWGATTDLSGIGQDAGAPQIVSSAEGSRIAVVWYRSNGSNTIVQSRRSIDGGATWGATTDLSMAGQNAQVPQVTSSADGIRVTAVWNRSNGSNTIVQSRTSADGGATWGATTDLSMAGQNAQVPQVTSSADGIRVTAVWNRSNGSNTIVQSRTSADGGATWGATTDLSAAGQNANYPQVVYSAGGSRVTVLWYLSGSNNYVVQARTSADGGATWGVTTDLSATGRNIGRPQITSSADGPQLTAVWGLLSGANTIVQARTSGDGGNTWGATTDLSAAGQDTSRPQITSSADGTRLTAVWTRENGISNNVQAISGVVLTPTPTPTPPSPTPTPTPTPTPNPPGRTTLQVAAHAKAKPVAVGKRNILVKSVRSNGRIVSVRARCELHGKPLRKKTSGRLCAVVVKRTTSAQGQVRITAAPTCTRGLRVIASITARSPGLTATTWRRSWGVGQGRVTCRLTGSR